MFVERDPLPSFGKVRKQTCRKCRVQMLPNVPTRFPPSLLLTRTASSLKRRGVESMAKDTLSIVTCEGDCSGKVALPRYTFVRRWIPTRLMPSRLSPRPISPRHGHVKRYDISNSFIVLLLDHLFASSSKTNFRVSVSLFLVKASSRDQNPSNTQTQKRVRIQTFFRRSTELLYFAGAVSQSEHE
jgi:hypothetical protein